MLFTNATVRRSTSTSIVSSFSHRCSLICVHTILLFSIFILFYFTFISIDYSIYETWSSNDSQHPAIKAEPFFRRTPCSTVLFMSICAHVYYAHKNSYEDEEHSKASLARISSSFFSLAVRLFPEIWWPLLWYTQNVHGKALFKIESFRRNECPSPC